MGRRFTGTIATGYTDRRGSRTPHVVGPTRRRAVYRCPGGHPCLDWYEARWRERTVPFRRERGFHPVAGEVGRWPIYMLCDQDTVTLVET